MDVLRRFGPLSLLKKNGKPVCQMHEVARPLVAGGQPMQWELCRGRDKEPCEFYEECPARDGADGPENARITVGTHALLGQLDGAAGSTGLLVIDEPPPLLETTTLSLDALDLALRVLDRFDGRYAGAMLPAVVAVRAWLAEKGDIDRVCALADAVRACATAIDPADLAQAQRSSGVEQGDAVECARAAQFPDRQSAAPPIQFLHIKMARGDVGRAAELGTASGVLRAVYHALTSEMPIAARIEMRQDQRVLLLTAAREQLVGALRREGAVVVLDANAGIDRKIYEKVVGYEPPYHHFGAVDGAPIERTLLRCSSATRKRWIPHRQLVLDPSLLTALRALFDWAREDPAARKLGLITMHAIELAIAAVRQPNDEAIVKAWKECGQPPELLGKARVAFAPIVTSWPGELLLGHYGAVRGLNTMADVDCLATLGDPWPNLGSVKNDVAFLGLAEAWEARLEAMCRAELEQAHGRLRAVHRKRPARALHVGNILPSGAGWAGGKVKFRQMPTGRPKATTTMTLEELEALIAALGGTRAAARTAGCAESALRHYRAGRTPVPEQVADLLRRAVSSRHTKGSS